MARMAARTDLGEGTMIETARVLDAAFECAVRAGDSARLVEACYAATGRLVPPNGLGVRGLDQIRACWRSILDAGLADVMLDTPDVVSTGDVAYGIGRHALVYRPAEGGAVRDAGRRVLAYRRQTNGNWAVTADIWTSDGVVAEPAPAQGRARGARWRGGVPGTIARNRRTAARTSRRTRPGRLSARRSGSQTP